MLIIIIFFFRGVFIIVFSRAPARRLSLLLAILFLHYSNTLTFCVYVCLSALNYHDEASVCTLLCVRRSSFVFCFFFFLSGDKKKKKNPRAFCFETDAEIPVGVFFFF